MHGVWARTAWCLAIALAVTASALGAPAALAATCDDGAATTPPGVAALQRLGGHVAQPRIAIAMHARVPDATVTARLRALGLAVQPLRKLPMSILYGPPDRLLAAARTPGVRDVYPDRKLHYASRKSTAAIGADQVWSARGFTGKGVGIAVVDSGVDATHPAFEQRVRRNVKLIGPEYIEAFGLPVSPLLPRDSIAVPVDQGPYSNTDTYGHGTHVAGVALAGDVGGSSEDSPVGVAPGAHLISYAVGEARTFSVLAAFDDILATHRTHNIKVVNNSWADRFSLFDPNAPINVATKGLFDAGIVTTFAAGNETDQLTLNGAAVAPWVISVGSATLAGTALPTSSMGLPYDNATAGPVQGHGRFAGDGLGLYYPHVTAPGQAILSTATPTGVGMSKGPGVPGGTAEATGTSMAAPHVAGLAALLLQANPDLSPGQIKQLLQATATPAPGWGVPKTGFGFVNAARAVDLALASATGGSEVGAAFAARRDALLERRSHGVSASDHWTFAAALPTTVGGLDGACFAFAVTDADVRRVQVALRYAGTAEGTRNGFEWTLRLKDAAGSVVATSRTLLRTGVSLIDLTLDKAPALGTWTIDVVGDRGASIPAPLLDGEMNLVATQLVPRPSAPDPAEERVAMMLRPSAAPAPALSSPEGCTVATPPAAGVLATATADTCEAALVGVDAKDAAGQPTFTSAPLAQPITVTGKGALVLHLADEAAATRKAAINSRVFFKLDAFDPAAPATALALASGQPDAVFGEGAHRSSYDFDAVTATVPAGWALRLRVYVSGAGTIPTRLLYGGSYDSAVLVPTR